METFAIVPHESERFSSVWHPCDHRAVEHEPTSVCSVTLIVTGHPMDPDDVTRALSMEPDRTWRAGEHKRVELPGGTKVLESRSEDSGWKKFTPAERYDRPAQEQLDHWLDIVRQQSQALASLRALGHEARLDCFVGSSEVIALGPEDLAALAAAALDLVLTVSADD